MKVVGSFGFECLAKIHTHDIANLKCPVRSYGSILEIF